MAPCITCGQTEDWHRDHKPRHTFTTEAGTPLEETPSPAPPPTVGGSGDPVLRLALLRAGVLTEENLSQATQWLQAARENGQAVLILPDEAGDPQYHLVGLQEAMAMKAGQ